MEKSSNKPSNTQEEKLLTALRESDRKAFETLFHKYYPMLCAYCHKFVSLEDSEEIVQDCLLWLWENRKQLPVEKSLSHYLFTSVYHKALNKIASQEAKNKANTIFFEQMQEMLQDARYYQEDELKETIRQAIRRLPDSYRQAFVMHRFQEMTYKEIAEELGVSSKTVDYRIQQSLKLLREDLKKNLHLKVSGEKTVLLIDAVCWLGLKLLSS